MSLNFSRFESRLNELSRVMDGRLGQLEASIVGRLEAKIEQRTADLMKWSFVFWCGAVAAVHSMPS